MRGFEIKNTMERRNGFRPTLSISVDNAEPNPGEIGGTGYFQEKYVMEGRLRTFFWANRAQFDRAADQAQKELRHFMYRDFLEQICVLDRAIEEMDQDELRRVAGRIKKIISGEQTGDET